MSHRKSDLGIPCPRKICQSSARACTHRSPSRVRFRANRTSRRHRRMTESDPNVWTRRALQEKTISLEITVLHQCIRPRVGAHAPDHHGNPRAIRSYYRPCLGGLLGSSVLGWAGKTISPSLLFLSQTSVGKDRGAYIACLLIA